MRRRHSIRLPGFDYSSEGVYFVTIVAHHREHLFGEINDGEMALSEFGRIVQEEWIKTPIIRHEIELDEFVIMPNHFHAIVYINCAEEKNDFVGAYGHTPLQEYQSSFRSPSKTLGALIRGFKGSVTTRVNELRGTPGTPVWQRNYYEHIIGTDRECENIAGYIMENPLRWSEDEENDV